MVKQQQLMIDALLQGAIGPNRGGNAMTPSENSRGRRWEDVRHPKNSTNLVEMSNLDEEINDRTSPERYSEIVARSED